MKFIKLEIYKSWILRKVGHSMEFHERNYVTTPERLPWEGLGDRIKVALKARDKNQIWLATKLNVSTGSLSKYLGGKNATIPPYDVVVRTAELLDADPVWLAFGYIPRDSLWFLSEAEVQAEPLAAFNAAIAHLDKVVAQVSRIKSLLNID